MEKQRSSQRLLIAIWLLSVTIGFAALLRYANTPSQAAVAAPASWPQSSQVPRSSGKATLVLFAHPNCSCTNATLAELERLIPALRGKVDLNVVFRSGTLSPLWRKAASLPTVKTGPDPGGFEAALFGAKTSGQAFLYDSGGTLVFQGGLTPSRAHEGESLGKQALLEFAESGHTSIHQSRVFGCALQSAPPLRNAKAP